MTGQVDINDLIPQIAFEWNAAIVNQCVKHHVDPYTLDSIIVRRKMDANVYCAFTQGGRNQALKEIEKYYCMIDEIKEQLENNYKDMDGATQ